MAMQRIEQNFRRGLETLGLITPRMLVPRVAEALKLYRDEGIDAATASQLRKKIDELYPATGWFPMSKGSLPIALMLMEDEGQITSSAIRHEDETGRIRDIPTYSITEKSQQL